MRYIDAEALIKKIYPIGIGDGRYTINAKAVKLAIDNAPTADVVPKSEVEELKAIIADHKASEERMEELYSNTKAEVAREIFEEVENEINNELTNNKKVLPQVEISNVLWNRVSGRINAFQGILEFIAELKKKYIEN